MTKKSSLISSANDKKAPWSVVLMTKKALWSVLLMMKKKSLFYSKKLLPPATHQKQQHMNKNMAVFYRGRNCSVDTASNWKARHNNDKGSSPQCSTGFFSQSQLSVQTLWQCPYSPQQKEWVALLLQLLCLIWVRRPKFPTMDKELLKKKKGSESQATGLKN